MTETSNAAVDVEERAVAACPSSEELRMVRAIASSAVSEAIARGESHVSFRRFRVNTVRLSSQHEKHVVISVELVVSLDGHMIDRESVEIFHFMSFDAQAHQKAMRDDIHALR
jgi:hypothetical protein